MNLNFKIYISAIVFLTFTNIGYSLDNHGGAASACNCYLDNDCNTPLVCHTGLACSEGKHVVKGPNPNFPDSTINNHGLCRQFGPQPDEFRSLLASVAELYISAIEVAGSLPDSGDTADARFANESIVRRALVYDISEEEHHLIRSLVTHIVMLTVGPADSVNINFKHRSGYYEQPDFDQLNTSEQSKESAAVAELGAIFTLDTETLAALALIRHAVFMEIRNPDIGLFEKEIQSLKKTLPNYKTFSACEYPHPIEHGHDFIFEDGIDCLSTQIKGALDSFNGIQKK